jgi:GAF domain-containing protein
MHVASRHAACVNRPLAAGGALLAPSVAVGLVMAPLPDGDRAGAADDGDDDPVARADAVLRAAVEAVHRSRALGEPVVAHEGPGRSDRARLAALDRAAVHDPDLDEVFVSSARLVSAACGTPQAIVSFVGAEVEWVRAAVDVPGTDLAGAGCCGPRQLALADVVVRRREVVMLSELAVDPRCRSRHVSWQFGAVAYAAAPIADREGRTIGALAVLDVDPFDLTARRRRSLVTLADEVMGVLESRR